jgi:hypothetical protein
VLLISRNDRGDLIFEIETDRRGQAMTVEVLISSQGTRLIPHSSSTTTAPTTKKSIRFPQQLDASTRPPSRHAIMTRHVSLTNPWAQVTLLF